jgi:D-threo-aldose 1-dehydrogenase
MGLGTGPLGKYRPISQEHASAVIHYALDNGIRFIDTAPYYGSGLSEQYLGAALAQVPRSSYVLATKVGRIITPEGKAQFDFTRDGILRSIEDSLKRLQLDYVDILHIHDPDQYYHEALHTVFPVLAELRSQGLIKAIGAGMNQWQMLADFARNADFDCFLLAGRYTLLEQGALTEFLPLCQMKGISVFLGGVYNSGILARGAKPGAQYNYKDAPPEILERARHLEEVCARYGIPLHVAALQFPFAHPAVTAVIVGAESPNEITTNLQALRTPIPTELWTALKEEGLLDKDAPTPSQPIL